MPEPLQQAGYRIRDWVKLVGIGVALYFNLKRDGKGPHETNLGRAVIITEPPGDYLARMALEFPAPARTTRSTARPKAVQAVKPAPKARRKPTPSPAPTTRRRATQ